MSDEKDLAEVGQFLRAVDRMKNMNCGDAKLSEQSCEKREGLYVLVMRLCETCSCLGGTLGMDPVAIPDAEPCNSIVAVLTRSEIRLLRSIEYLEKCIGEVETIKALL